LIPERSNTIFSTTLQQTERLYMYKIAGFFLHHGFKIMITGFIISTAGIFMVIKIQHNNGNIAFTVASIGLGLWLFGRICIIINQRRMRRQREQTVNEPSGSEK
jgi:hypothetical protein